MTTNNITQEQIDEALDTLRAALDASPRPLLTKEWRTLRDGDGLAAQVRKNGFLLDIRSHEHATGTVYLMPAEARALIPVIQQFLEDQA